MWYYIFVFLWLSSLSMIISRSMQCVVATNGNILFYFYGWVIFLCVCVCVHINTYHIFMQLSVDGHLGYFHVLAIVNSATLNIRVHVSFWIIVLLGYMPKNGIVGSYDNYFYCSFLPFSIVAASIYIPTNSVTFSPQPLQQFIICRLHDDGHSDW